MALSNGMDVWSQCPFDRDPQFLGREDIIADIDQKLESKRRVALSGIGGVGLVHGILH